MTKNNFYEKEINRMNTQDKRGANNPATLVEDLTITEDQAAAVKGGPIFMNYEGISGDVTSAGHEKWIEYSGGPQPTGAPIKTK
jgi:hypothetical protein